MIDKQRISNTVRVASVTLLVGLIGFSGCSGGSSARPKTLPVSGSVKLKGVPVANIQVTFFADGKSPRNPYGMTDAQGNFKLTSYDTNDGAVAGDYVVTLSSAKSAGKPEEMTAQKMIDMSRAGIVRNDDSFPAKYGDAKTSDLKRSVVAGDTNVFNFDITE